MDAENMNILVILTVVVVVVGFPAAVGVVSVIADRVTYGNWIWRSRKR